MAVRNKFGLVFTVVGIVGISIPLISERLLEPVSVVILAGFVVMFVRLVFADRCPKCKKMWALETQPLRRSLEIVEECKKCGFTSQKNFNCTLGEEGVTNDFSCVDVPDEISIQYHGSHMKISYRIFDRNAVILALVAIVWGSFTFILYSTMAHDAGLWQQWSPFLFALIGAVLAYCAIAGLLNKTTIFAGKEMLRVQCKPIPLGLSGKFQAGNIEQLYSKKDSSGHENPIFTYSVRIVLKNGIETTLVCGLKASNQALFIEQKIEKYLKIEGKEKPIGWVGYKEVTSGDLKKLIEKGAWSEDEINKLMKKIKK